MKRNNNKKTMKAALSKRVKEISKNKITIKNYAKSLRYLMNTILKVKCVFDWGLKVIKFTKTKYN